MFTNSKPLALEVSNFLFPTEGASRSSLGLWSPWLYCSLGRDVGKERSLQLSHELRGNLEA